MRSSRVSPSIQLDYKDGKPAWSLRLVQPQRFRDVEYSLHARLFLLPTGALIGVLLKFYDEPSQPYFIHRVMDLTDPAVMRHVKACVESKEILAIFETVGEQPGYDRPLALDAAQWRKCMVDGEAYNKSIKADGEKSLDDFLEVFRPVSETKGVDAAWEEVDRRYPPPPPKKGKGWGGLFGLILFAAFGYGVVVDDVHALATPGPHCHYMFCWRQPATVKAVGTRTGHKYYYCSSHDPITGPVGQLAAVGLGTVHVFAYVFALALPSALRDELRTLRGQVRAVS